MNEPISSKNKNPVARAAHELGGQARFARILGLYGLPVHKQSVYVWTCQGYVPARYKRAVRLMIKTYSKVLTDAQGLLDAVKPEHTPNSRTEFPNTRLKEWFDKQGGIAEFIKKVNYVLNEHNQRLRPGELPVKKWTYVMAHNWLKRGRVSDKFQDLMFRNFDCPREIMEARPNPADDHKLKGLHTELHFSEADLLGE